MVRCSGLLFVVSSFLVLVAIAEDPKVDKPAPAADHSQEAFVIEQFSRKEKFENDGASTQTDFARVRIQSDAGVQRYAVLDFSYPNATSTFEIEYVRVHKPDHAVVETPADNVQDMAAQITREAPFYSDLHEKHVAVKGLGVGDVLEFSTELRTTKPLASGQFWTSYQFTHLQIVLDEQLEISVPRDRNVKLKSRTIQPNVRDEGGYRIYSWRNSNTQYKDDSKDKRKLIEQAWLQYRGRQPQPDVMMSSFESWTEVGHWYDTLQQERVKPTPEIAAKASELTKNAHDEDAKIQALYSYVSTNFHYIGIAFGIGRYQPHPAGEVLANQYGDCKDKHTLLASLLAAIGIQAYPALISATREVDEDIPSPGQFDHVVTIVPREGNLTWLDTTAEVGPYQYLVSPLRDKHALAIWTNKPAALISTPSALPYAIIQNFHMDAKVSDTGALEGRAEVTLRGDLEYIMRQSFRTVPFPKWNALVQQISYGFGFAGEITEAIASSPEKTDEPFHFSYKYTRKDFGDWDNHRILAPEPTMVLLAPADEETLPLGPSWLGPLLDMKFTSTVELPHGYRPELPRPIHLKNNFAQFDATYEFRAGKLVSERHLQTLMVEIPASDRESYKQFAKTVQDDRGLFIQLASGSESPQTAETNAIAASINEIQKLPDSSNPDALQLESEAREQAAHDSQKAIASLYRAVGADPKFARAWVILAGLLMMEKQTDAGIEAFRKAMAADPTQPAIPKQFGFALMSLSKFDDAVPVWQDYTRAHPDDVDGPANLGNCLSELQRYPEAISAYEAAVKLREDRLNLQARLGAAYLKIGERGKASTTFKTLLEKDVDGKYYNDVSYQMANADLNLPVALEYAKKAVESAEDESQKITLQDLKLQDVKQAFTIAAYWDTLGWVYERMSNFGAGEQYLQSSWKLIQDGVVAGHLCHMYKRLHRTQNAIDMCRLAIYRLSTPERLRFSEYRTELNAAQENLGHLTNSSAKTSSTGDGSNKIISERTFKLPRFLTGTASAEFFVLLVSDGQSSGFKVQDVKFISGSDKMKAQGKQLKNIDFRVSDPPGGGPVRFVRRGILGCYQYTGCSFVVLDPATVNSLN